MIDSQHELCEEEEEETLRPGEAWLTGMILFFLFTCAGLLGASCVVLCWKALMWSLSL